MPVLCRFESRANRPVRTQSLDGHRPPTTPEALPQQGGGPPLLPLLEGLRGHTVTLQVNGWLVEGRLITTAPVTLVGPTGQVTVVDAWAIQSVQY
jgi:hypothetical protein